MACKQDFLLKALRTPSHCPPTGLNLSHISLPLPAGTDLGSRKHRSPPQSPERTLQDFFLFRQCVLFADITASAGRRMPLSILCGAGNERLHLIFKSNVFL
ncbi:MAG: hypothetical protein RR857_08915 [Comamonas sp.]